MKNKYKDIREMVLAVYYWKHEVRITRPETGLAGKDQKLAMFLSDEYKNARRMLRNANAALARYCRSQAAGFDLRGAPIGFYDMEPETYNKETDK